MLQKPNSGLTDAIKATSLDPKLSRAWIRMGKCATLLGDKASLTQAGNQLKILGDETFQEFHKIDEELNTFESTGESNMTLGRYKAACYWYNKCLTISPFCQKLRTTLAECLVYQGQFEAATVEIIKALDNDSKDVEALYIKGLSFYYQDLTEKALEFFKLVLKLDPDHQKTIKQ